MTNQQLRGAQNHVFAQAPLAADGRRNNVLFVRQGAVDEAVNPTVRQGPSRPQLKRDPLDGATQHGCKRKKQPLTARGYCGKRGGPRGVHQFLIGLGNTDPLVWHRIHVTIHGSMGWLDYEP